MTTMPAALREQLVDALARLLLEDLEADPPGEASARETDEGAA